MIRVTEMETTSPLAAMKAQFVRQATAPLDSMWLCVIVPLARHFGLFKDGDLIGYFCMNDEGYLLQFFVTPAAQSQASQLFEFVSTSADLPCGKIAGAFVSTAEPLYLSLCFDLFSKSQVNALMYQHDSNFPEKTKDSSLALQPIEMAQLPQAVDLAVASIGAPAALLDRTFSNLIRRQELFGVWQGEELIATGESRKFDEHQTEYADLGVMVGKAARSRGIATQILKRMAAMNEADGLKSICSTEKSNIAAQKAISRAGFFAGHRIIQFHG